MLQFSVLILIGPGPIIELPFKFMFKYVYVLPNQVEFRTRFVIAVADLLMLCFVLCFHFYVIESKDSKLGSVCALAMF